MRVPFALTSALALSLSLSLSLSISPAHAQNLLTNPGFETGDLTGYVQSNNRGFLTSTRNSGSFGYVNGTFGEVGTLTQTITTTPGARYNVSFFYNNRQDFTPELFGVSFAGVTLIPLSDPAVTAGFQQFTFSNIVAAGASSALTFSFQDDRDVMFLDDLSVTAVQANPPSAAPEPGSLVLLLPVMGSVGMVMGKQKRRRKQPGIPDLADSLPAVS